MPNRLPTEARQAEIVAAALRLACENSPPLITTADIAAAVGISQGAVFKHFASKDAIWLAAMAWVQARLLVVLAEAAEGHARELDAMQAMFEAHIAFVTNHPGVPRLIFHELMHPADSPVKREVRALLQTYRQRLLQRLAAAEQQGELRAGTDHNAAATSFVGLVQGLVMQAMATGAVAGMAAQAGAVFALYRRGLSEAP